MGYLLCRVSAAPVLLLTGVVLAGAANASELYIGPNGTANLNVNLYSTDGTAMGTYGPNGATSAASDGLGDTFVSVPDLINNQTIIFEYGSDPTTPLAQYTFQGVDSNASDGYVDDLAYGDGNLWAASYNGTIYQINFATSTVLSSFSTGSLFPGIATDGQTLYATTGFSSGVIDTYDLAGNLLSSIFTGLPDTLGIGYDPADKTLWVGGVGLVGQVDSTGTILSSFAVMTPGGDPIIASGVEVRNNPQVSPVPEPSAFVLCGLGLLCLAGVWRQKRKTGKGVLALVFMLAMAHPAFSTPNIASLTSVQPAPQPVGTSVTWNASASDGGQPLWYRFSVQPPGGSYSIVRDYQSAGSFIWNPSEMDGVYHIQVTVKNQTDQSVSSLAVGYQVSPRATTQPVVTGTANPLVALYSAPPCPAGSSMRVRFWKPGSTLYSFTSTKACTPSSSMNFYIGGMTATTTYSLQQDLIHGPSITPGPLMSFTTGTPSVSVPVSVLVSAKPPTSQIEGTLLVSGLNVTAAFDMNGNLTWYYPVSGPLLTRAEPGGKFLLDFGPSQISTLTQEQNSEREVMREIDLAGNTLLETNAARVGELLGYPVNSIHHEARRLPNGNLVFLVSTERMADQGAGTVDVLGDVIVVLDQNLNLVWSWSAFDHLDIKRPSTTNDICRPAGGGCPPVYLSPQANDWTHGNSVYVTSDNKYIVYSSRHQDWVIEIEYDNGAGNGDIVWKLGYQGDFTLTNGNSSDWFSHQHDVEFELNGQQILSLFDNGNHRQQPANTSDSRGQVYQIDAASRKATLQLNADLGAYSQALGVAQRLANGNYEFDLGLLPSAQFVEVNPAGGVVSKFQVTNRMVYRCFRMRDLYTP